MGNASSGGIAYIQGGAGGGGVAVSASGNNTSGVIGQVSSGTLYLAGGNNITLSQNGQSITIVGATAAGAGVGLSAAGQSATAGNLTFSNSNSISFGMAASVVTASFSQTNQNLSLFGLGNTTQNSSTVLGAAALSFNGLGEITAGFSNGSIQISAPPSSIGVSGGNTSGTSGTFSGQVVFAGGNNITLSVASAAGGAQTITISGAAAGGAQTGISSVIVSNTTYTSGAVSFSNANGLSFGSSAGQAITASYTQSGQAVSAQGGSSTFSTLVFTNSNNVSFSNTGGSVWGSYALNVSAPGGTSNALSGITFTNSGGVSFGLSTGAGVGTMSAAVATTAAYYFVNNTTGQSSSSTAADQTLSYSLGGALSGGWTNGTVLLSAPATSSISGTGLVSVAVNGSTISIGAAVTQLSFFQPLGAFQNTTVTQNGLGSVQVYPAVNPFPFTASRVDMMASLTASALALSTQAQTLSMYVGLYSLNGSTLSLASSGSQSYAFSNSSNNSNASITGIRRFSAPINVNYTGGFDLFIGVMTNTTFVNTNGIGISNVVMPIGPGPQLQGLIGQVPANSMQFVPGQGIFSTTSAALPSSMALSAISGAGSGGNAVDYYSPVQFANVTA